MLSTPLSRFAPLLLALALGCGPRPAAAPAPAAAATLLPSLQARTDGDTVVFLLQVTNTGEAAVPLAFPSAQEVEFRVLAEGGREVWRWSEGRQFAQAVRERTLPPGATETYQAVWTPPPGTRGSFTVVGALTAPAPRVEQRMVLRLP